MAARYEPKSDKFEDYHAGLAEIRATYEIKFGNICSFHTKCNSSILDYAYFYEDVAHRYPPKKETGHAFRTFADFVYNGLSSRAASTRTRKRYQEICSRGPSLCYRNKGG